MILIIDATSDQCLVAVYDGKKLEIVKWLWQKDTGSEVLKNVQNLLKKRQKNLKNIKVIVVNQGPGSYTGTRVGITIANTLGWSLKIPVVGYSDKNLVKVARETYQKINKGQFFPSHFPTPIYKRETRARRV